jgi:hypothetical protein
LWKTWENDKTVFPPFPQILEIAPRFPHSLRPAADNLYPIFKPKRSLPQLPNPLTFRLIFRLEKTEAKRISLVTTAALVPDHRAKKFPSVIQARLQRIRLSKDRTFFPALLFPVAVSGLEQNLPSQADWYRFCTRLVRAETGDRSESRRRQKRLAGLRFLG